MKIILEKGQKVLDKDGKTYIIEEGDYVSMKGVSMKEALDFDNLPAYDSKKKRLTPEAKKLVDKYKLLNQQLDSLLGSVFAGQSQRRIDAMEAEQQEINARMKKLGYNLDLYW